MAGPPSNVEADNPEGFDEEFNIEQGGKSQDATVLDLPGTSGEVAGSGPGEYLGYSVRETSGSAAAYVILYDNASAASGEILDEIQLAQSASADSPPVKRGQGKQVVNGIYAAITGAVQGSVLQ